MTAYLITTVALGLLALGVRLNSKPGEPRKPLTAGDILVALAIQLGFTTWAAILLYYHIAG